MMAVSTETWDVHSNLSYCFFFLKKKSFGHNDKLSYTYFKTKFKHLHKTHGPDNSTQNLQQQKLIEQKE